MKTTKTNATTPAASTSKAATPAAKESPKATAPVTPAPKAATPAAPVTPKAPAPTRLGKSGIAVLAAISKEPLTRAEISLRTGIKSGFCSLLGHVDPTKTEPSSLAYKGYLIVGVTEGKSASTYTITDKGREALKAATTPPTAAPAVPTAPKATDPKPATAPAKTETVPVKAAAKKVAPKK